jgi:transposase-like protein
VILWGVRWYVAYPMSYRQLEEMMEERGVEVDHSTLNRWVVKYAPLLEKQFRARKRAIGSSGRLDETYVKVKGCWKYLYRAVDKAGATVDFLLTTQRDCKAALRLLRKAIGQHGEPEKITIDKSGANTAAIERYNAEGFVAIFFCRRDERVRTTRVTRRGRRTSVLDAIRLSFVAAPFGSYA